jgi:hypothetical protein
LISTLTFESMVRAGFVAQWMAQVWVVLPQTELPVASSITVPVREWRHPSLKPWALDDIVRERWLRHDDLVDVVIEKAWSLTLSSSTRSRKVLDVLCKQDAFGRCGFRPRLSELPLSDFKPVEDQQSAEENNGPSPFFILSNTFLHLFQLLKYTHFSKSMACDNR